MAVWIGRAAPTSTVIRGTRQVGSNRGDSLFEPGQTNFFETGRIVQRAAAFGGIFVHRLRARRANLA